MNDDLNPTLPLAFDVIWSLAALALLVLAVTAVVSILRTDHSRGGGRFWWSLFVIVVPLLGPLLWFWSSARR